MHEAIGEPPVVLIVDDDIPITEILALVIEGLGYQPVVAWNGHQALTLARKHWPALVLTDMMMPILGGKEVVKGLHEEAGARGMAPPPIVLLTAGTIWPEIASLVDAIISKPFEMDELEQLIYRFLPPSASW
ncbi:hypothetical protein KDH_00790 [Dictyobacter sp. S3.2.2.5]|uniref:Response regulatory domain-containing protein n=1 Tax=Dictyobacter halimunensis TaxID=3026934 RepID=A0ABQ6FI26_9CHLR|nr:hypothetical protein KDH_00790 [Dictyobacter sp. S3.2.2.5]